MNQPASPRLQARALDALDRIKDATARRCCFAAVRK
jgi:hypothetical protein